MKEQSGVNEAVVVGAGVIGVALLIVGSVWGVAAWAEDRFGEVGSIVVGVLGIAIVIVMLVLAIGMFFAKIYRAGVVDTIRGQQITQQGNTQAVRDITQAVRGELTYNARNAASFERDVQKWADKKANVMISARPQLTGPVEDAIAENDADWYELRQAHGITYDE